MEEKFPKLTPELYDELNKSLDTTWPHHPDRPGDSCCRLDYKDHLGRSILREYGTPGHNGSHSHNARLDHGTGIDGTMAVATTKGLTINAIDCQAIAIILIPATKRTNDRRCLIVGLANRLLPYCAPM